MVFERLLADPVKFLQSKNPERIFFTGQIFADFKRRFTRKLKTLFHNQRKSAALSALIREN